MAALIRDGRLIGAVLASLALGVTVTHAGEDALAPGKEPAILALSDLNAFDPDSAQDASPETPAIPDPEPLLQTGEPDAPDGEAEGASQPETDGAVAILYDTDILPEPAARMRTLIMEAAATGDLEALRPLIGIGPEATRLTIGGLNDDPIDFLRASSGDEGGQEILAILLDVLDAGFVLVEREGETPVYLWPYFFAVPLEELTDPQKVELMRIVTAGDYAEMQVYGGYNFYRIGITAEGAWSYFVAGH
ncbi:hypothetical protein [Pararhizobium haloflavum]|uniref:hypothetical protein n=1 Tax=Pararhizobium haloflavum TaxID=2037914 RepID=UPI000C189B59|nr:hypothetical protein [Pararhizobium haloflavum]